jgi:hypothetical protein
MQRILNYGSFLQAYGLGGILQEIGCCVEFVDYHPGKTLVPADGGTGLKRKIAKAADVFLSPSPFIEKIRFIRYKKNYASNYYPYLGISDHMNYNPQVDALVIGSDEVFNCVQNNPNVGFSPELFGEGNRAGKLISYAASFGNTTMEKLEQYKVSDSVAGWLSKFDALSVRDDNSAQIVKKLTGNTPQIHLDPVLMYDFSGDAAELPAFARKQNYMILYGYSGRFTHQECKKIRKYARERRLKIFCIGGVQECCDHYIDCNPFEVIACFKNATCVVTDTFHGTILSVITHRQFATTVRKSGYGNSEKLSDLLTRLELRGRICDSMDSLSRIMSTRIDYERTDAIIAKERERTYAYLRNSILGE